MIVPQHDTPDVLRLASDEGVTRIRGLEPPWRAITDQRGTVISEVADLGGGVLLRRVLVEDERFHPSPGRHLVVHLAGDAQLETTSGDTLDLRPGTVAVSEDIDGGHRIVRPAGSPARMMLLVPLRDGGDRA